MTLSIEAMHSLIVLRDAINDHFSPRQRLGLAPTIQKAITAFNAFVHYVADEGPREKIDYYDMNVEDLSILAETDAEALTALRKRSGSNHLEGKRGTIIVDDPQRFKRSLDAILKREGDMYIDPLTEFSKQIEETKASKFADDALDARILMANIAADIDEINGTVAQSKIDEIIGMVEQDRLLGVIQTVFDKATARLSNEQISNIANRISNGGATENVFTLSISDEYDAAFLTALIKENRRQCARQTWEAAKKYHMYDIDYLKRHLEELGDENASLRREVRHLNELVKNTGNESIVDCKILEPAKPTLFGSKRANDLQEAFIKIHGIGTYVNMLRDSFNTTLLSQIPLTELSKFEALIRRKI